MVPAMMVRKQAMRDSRKVQGRNGNQAISRTGVIWNRCCRLSKAVSGVGNGRDEEYQRPPGALVVARGNRSRTTALIEPSTRPPWR